jgi:hypothetical protein
MPLRIGNLRNEIEFWNIYPSSYTLCLPPFHCVFRIAVPGICGQNDVESLERIYQRVQEARTLCPQFKATAKLGAFLAHLPN